MGKRELSLSVCLSLGRRAPHPSQEAPGPGATGQLPFAVIFWEKHRDHSQRVARRMPWGPGGSAPGVLLLTAHTGLEADPLPQSPVDSVVAKGGRRALGGGGT